MVMDRGVDARFDIKHEASPPDALVMGFSEFGLAGLTAVEYLVDQLGLEETGHITVEGLPAITPFENGTPRHHTRIFGGGEDFAVLVGELFVPLPAAKPFADAIADWLSTNDVAEVTSLSGVPIEHGPDNHVFRGQRGLPSGSTRGHGDRTNGPWVPRGDQRRTHGERHRH